MWDRIYFCQYSERLRTQPGYATVFYKLLLDLPVLRPHFDRCRVHCIKHRTIANAVTHFIRRYLLNFQDRLTLLKARPAQLFEIFHQVVVQSFPEGLYRIRQTRDFYKEVDGTI